MARLRPFAATLVAASLVLAVLLAGAPGPTLTAHARATEQPTASAASRCHGAHRRGAGRAYERAILCLVNAERAKRGLSRLRRSRSLASGVRRHARDMSRRNYFAHRSPAGSSSRMRARRSGYRYAILAENLGFGARTWGTPAGIIRQWLQSPGHRRAMLDGRFRDLGVGAARGVPVRGVRGGTTVGAVFGRR